MALDGDARLSRLDQGGLTVREAAPRGAADRALPPSLYRDTAPPGPPTPPLRGERRAEVAIVGGGITGLSAALHLAEAGVDAVVLDAREPGWGASGRNGGQVNPGLKEPPDTVERAFGADLGGRMVAMSHAAPGLVFELARRHGIDCGARQAGTIRAATNERSAAALRDLAADYVRRGMGEVSLLEGLALREAVGTDRYRVGLLDRRGGNLHPLAYSRGLARAALAAGASVHGDSPAKALRSAAGEWELTVPGGRVTARRVLLATNGYTDGLWPGLRRSVVPVASAIASTEPMPEGLARTVLPSRASVFETGRITVYYRVDGEGRLLMGGRGPQRRETRDPDMLPHLIGRAERLWPGLRGMRWTHGWGGRVAMTRDHYPHLHEPAPGLFACLGYNGRGVAMATMMGRQLARHLAGGGPADMPVTPVAPIRLHALWPLAVSAEVWRGRVLDGLGR